MRDPQRRAEAADLVPILVQPRSSRTGVELRHDGRLVLRVHAPAAEGAANEECLRLLAKTLGVRKSSIQIARGQKGRAKLIAVSGMSGAEARVRLARSAAQP
jgi:hypothetical protein